MIDYFFCSSSVLHNDFPRRKTLFDAVKSIRFVHVALSNDYELNANDTEMRGHFSDLLVIFKAFRESTVDLLYFWITQNHFSDGTQSVLILKSK